MDGMLGGYGHISSIDITSSRKFLQRFLRVGRAAVLSRRRGGGAGGTACSAWGATFPLAATGSPQCVHDPGLEERVGRGDSQALPPGHPTGGSCYAGASRCWNGAVSSQTVLFFQRQNLCSPAVFASIWAVGVGRSASTGFSFLALPPSSVPGWHRRGRSLPACPSANTEAAACPLLHPRSIFPDLFTECPLPSFHCLNSLFSLCCCPFNGVSGVTGDERTYLS